MGIINKAKIKEITEFQVSEEFLIELEKQAEALIKRAETRAKANSRHTLMDRDL